MRARRRSTRAPLSVSATTRRPMEARPIGVLSPALGARSLIFFYSIGVLTSLIPGANYDRPTRPCPDGARPRGERSPSRGSPDRRGSKEGLDLAFARVILGGCGRALLFLALTSRRSFGR